MNGEGVVDQRFPRRVVATCKNTATSKNTVVVAVK